MYIGALNHSPAIFTHKGTNIPFPPASSENGVPLWPWNYAYDAPIDATYTLDRTSFIGAVCVCITPDSVTAVEVLADGKCAGRYSAENGRLIGGEVTVPVGIRAKAVTVRFYTSLKDLSVERVEILGAEEDGNPLVYPTPKSIEFFGGYTKIKDIVSKNGDADELFAVEFLKERLTETVGNWQSTHGSVIVFDKRASKSYAGERYTVRCTRQKITVAAASRITLLYGADTLLQVTDARRGVRKCRCDDHPSKELRGFHTGLPGRRHFEFMRRLFRYVLLPLRYNTLYVEIAGSMRFHSHPEINEAWENAIAAYHRGEMPRPPHVLAEEETLEHEEVARFVDYARELGFEIVPEVQSLGHVQYITVAHPELAEIDENEVVVTDTRAEDARPASVYRHCYCPSLEESYRLIFDLMDEIIDVVRPARYVHIGHDEVYQIGVCPRCRGKNPADLFAEHVTRLHDHLAARGLGTVMWADMLQPPTVRPYLTYPAVERLPRDIILLDFVWYFKTDADIEDNLLPYGYRVGVGNLYSSHYPRYQSRISKKNMIGGQISLWTDPSEPSLAENGKLWDTAFLSEMLWNSEGYDERQRRTYTEIIAKDIQPRQRDLIRGVYNPAGYKATAFKLPAGKKAPRELLALCPRAVEADETCVTVGGKFDRLVFEHATKYPAPRVAWNPTLPIGAYTVRYADGSETEVPVTYAGNVMAYNTFYGTPMPQEFYRHTGYVGTWLCDPVRTGKTDTGEDVGTYGFVWENPRPDAAIESVTYRAAENDFCNLILVGVQGYNKR